MLDVALLGQPILRQKARKVNRKQIKSSKFQKFANELTETMLKLDGIGLAAPQVYESKTIFVARFLSQYLRKGQILYKINSKSPIYQQKTSSNLTKQLVKINQPIVFINPFVTPLSSKQTNNWEGCLSLPGLMVQVPRYEKVSLDFIDLKNQPHSIILENTMAEIVQHEYDHLIGKLMIDRAKSTKDIWSAEAYYQLKPM